MVNKLDEKMLIRFSHQEKAALESTAKLVNISVSDLVRQAATERARLIRDTVAKYESFILGSVTDEK